MWTKLNLSRLAPGLVVLLAYRREWWRSDLRAGLSVAAVALPVAIAYAALAGVSPMAGLYSCMLPMLVYALFGSSRQLMVGPDAATCAVIAAVVTPLAAGDPARHWQLVVVLTLMTGIWCLLGSRLRFGTLADFLSRPILMGLLNGVALTIMVGQLARILGFRYEDRGLIERLVHSLDYLTQTHLPTLGISMLTLLGMVLIRRLRPQWPSTLMAMVGCMLLSYVLDLDRHQVLTLGPLANGLPSIHWLEFPPSLLRELVLPALNLALVSFVSMMLTARSFAAKGGYEIDADQEFRALGLANIAAALSQGFAISGADSRTAVNDAAGGMSQMVSVVAALAIGVVTFFLMTPLQYIPLATLGVVLLVSAASLTDLRGLWALRRSDPGAFVLALLTFLAVLLVGVLPGIALAVLLGLFQFLRSMMRPSDQLLGVDEQGVVHALGHGDLTHAIPHVVVYRFNASLTYFNAPYFKRRVLDSLHQAPQPPTLMIVDAVACFSHLDISVMSMLAELQRALRQHGCRLWLAGRRTTLTRWLHLAGIEQGDEGIRLCSDLYSAIRRVANEQAMSELAQKEVAGESSPPVC
jgi:high affinity sulfate transporter 1